MVDTALIVAGALTCIGVGYYMGAASSSDVYAQKRYDLHNEKVALDHQLEIVKYNARPLPLYVPHGNRATFEATLGGHYPGTRTIIPGGVVLRVLARAYELNLAGRFFSRRELCEGDTALLTATQFGYLGQELDEKGYLLLANASGVSEWTPKGLFTIRAAAHAMTHDSV